MRTRASAEISCGPDSLAVSWWQVTRPSSSSRWSSIFASIMPWQAPQSPPARQALVTAARVWAPAVMAESTSASVTARQTQTYIAVLKIMKPVFIIKGCRGRLPALDDKKQRQSSDLHVILKAVPQVQKPPEAVEIGRF